MCVIILLFIVQRRLKPLCARVGDHGGGTTSTKSVMGGLDLFLWVPQGSCGVMGILGALSVSLSPVSPAGTRSVSGNIHLGALPATAVAMWPLSHSARGVTAAGRWLLQLQLRHTREDQIPWEWEKEKQIPWEMGEGRRDPLGAGLRKNTSVRAGKRKNPSPGSRAKPLSSTVPAVLSLVGASVPIHSWGVLGSPRQELGSRLQLGSVGMSSRSRGLIRGLTAP